MVGTGSEDAMEPGAIIRFEDSANGTVTGRHYDVRGTDNALIYACDTEGHCIKRPTEFMAAPDDAEPTFTMTAKGKIMNMTYFVDEGRDGRRIGTIHGKGVGFAWKVLDAAEDELMRFVDPSSMKEAFVRDILGGSPDRYAVIQGGRVLARIRREPRPEKPGLPGGWRAVVRRILKLHDWTLQPEVVVEDPVVRKLLVAGMILLIEHQIRSRASA